MKALEEALETPSLWNVKENFQLKNLGLPRIYLTPKLRSVNNKLYRRSQQGERNVTRCVQLFDLTNKAT